LKLKQARLALEAAQEEHQSEVRQFAGRRERIDSQQLRLEKQLEELEARGEETRGQRRRIAQQFRIERAALVQERELIQSEIDRQRKVFQSESGRGKTELGKDRENFEQEMNRTRQQLRRERQQLEEDLAALEQTRRAADKNRANQSADLSSAQQEIHKLVALLAESQQSTADATEQLSRLQQANDALKLEITKQASGEEAVRVTSNLQHERDLLTARIQLLEDQLNNAEKQLADRPTGIDEQHADELHRRFEMAVDDVRQLKRRNAELEEELADYQAAAVAQQPKSAASETVATDWESTKKRLLAELDEDEANPSGARLTDDDRLSVEGAIRITDEVIVARDQQIAELKQLLAQQTEQMAAESSAPQAPAIDPQIFDQDEIIRQERERLAVLEKELQGKLRQAEVELSVERAKIARERSGLEEQQRQLASEKAAMAGQRPGQSANPNAPKKPGQRWLARLGLKENDNE
jgi:chromosome segregation ATPase